MIGVSSTVFSTMDFGKVFEMVGREFNHWEIISEGEHCLMDVSERFFELAPSYDMSYSVHAPMSDINLASLNERMREGSIFETINTIDTAMEMNAKTITFHPGLLPMSMPQMKDKSIEACKRSLRSLDRIAAEYSAPLALENMPSFPFMLGRTTDEFKELIEGTNLQMCFDFGHANTNSQIDDFIKGFKDRIVNIHIHDNNGEKDEHLTCGKGNIDFGKHLKKLDSYSGTYIIEAKSYDSAVESKKYLEKLL